MCRYAVCVSHTGLRQEISAIHCMKGLTPLKRCPNSKNIDSFPSIAVVVAFVTTPLHWLRIRVQ